MTTNLRKVAREKLFKDMISLEMDNWKILITDPTTLKILNSLCTMADIQDCQFAIIENILNKRSPNQDYDAYYFIEPTTSNIQLLIDDFKHKPPYKTINLFTTKSLPDSLLDKIKRSPATHYLTQVKQLNIDFIVQESIVFNLNKRNSIYTLFNPKTTSALTLELRQTAIQIANVLATLGEFPYIKYFKDDSRSVSLTEKLAFDLQSELLKNKDFNSDRATLLIVDRSFDLVSPLIHEFSYQALLADVIGFEDGKIKWNGVESQDGYAKLDEQDKIWTEFRHLHVAETMESLSNQVKKFTNENSAAQYSKNSGGNSLDQISKMQETLQALPEYQEQKAKFSLHTDLCQDCMRIYSEKSLENVITFEQELATNETSASKQLKNPFKDLINILSSDVGHHEKLRLAMIFIITQKGTSQDERTKLFQVLDDYSAHAITNLSQFGVRQSKLIDSSQISCQFTVFKNNLEPIPSSKPSFHYSQRNI